MILFTSDLLFGSKILGAARHAGLRGQGVRNRASLSQHAPNATHYFLDLEADLADGESAEELLDAALGHPHLCVYAFAGHLRADKLRAAQARLSTAGSRHQVHSRGSLNSRLVEILPPAGSAPAPAREEGS
jgi:hypothetical protein